VLFRYSVTTKKSVTVQEDRHPFNGLFSRTTWASQHQKGLTTLDFNEGRLQEMMGGSAISWTICKSFASHSNQITKPATHHLIFHMLDALLDAQPTVSKH